MNDDIYEIINALVIPILGYSEGVEFSPDVCEKLYNYITNLQNENKELKKNQRLTPEQRDYLLNRLEGLKESKELKGGDE